MNHGSDFYFGCDSKMESSQLIHILNVQPIPVGKILSERPKMNPIHKHKTELLPV